MDAVRAKKQTQATPEDIAQRLLKELTPRFVRLAKAEGHVVEDEPDQIWLKIGTHGKLACEAKFDRDVHYDRIFRSFQGWAEANAKKLGVKQIYANAGNDEDDAA